ncbi:GntR family transcriptional regulator [Kerstersia similis]|uniref:GntR family transcriptional regulator n=1 Tax=Kerstersia similis TaxID=206505 RepID=UPI0039EF0663
MAELKQVEKENLSMRIYRQIRSALIDGQYEPGERLRIATLAAELGTSITPVREAIFRLVSEQALEMRAATAVIVPALNAAKLREVQQVRLLLEGAAAEHAAQIITPDQLAHMERLQDAFIEAVEANDPRLAAVRNRDFHFGIVTIAAKPTIEAIVENMWVQMGPVLNMFHSRMPRRQVSTKRHPHYDVLAAFRRKDPEAAREALQQDIRWSNVWIDAIEQDQLSGPQPAQV